VLNIGLLTVRLTAPLPGVVGVEVVHHAGAVDRGPHFEIADDPGHRPETPLDDDAAEIRSGR
jgi:alpha-D-xyloside xylohydrolase